MIPNKLIQTAVAAALLAAATGQLPLFIKAARVAQHQLLKDSQASKWGKALLLQNESIGKSGLSKNR